MELSPSPEPDDGRGTSRTVKVHTIMVPWTIMVPKTQWRSASSFVTTDHWYCDNCGIRDRKHRFECQQCLAGNVRYDLCYQCILEAPQIHPGHHFYPLHEVAKLQY
ncbi:unnamed protein product [Rotaria magnacalcarata]|uniref:ZZ-type domain-containing protein n=2 Tax=Rotaria magnacalcarata TaxID=392030 RepID=A0A8S3CLK9_9BILA|nr:unnamed protein product [Rotaria magnacalcarata]